MQSLAIRGGQGKTNPGQVTGNPRQKKALKKPGKNTHTFAPGPKNTNWKPGSVKTAKNQKKYERERERYICGISQVQHCVLSKEGSRQEERETETKRVHQQCLLEQYIDRARDH